MGGGGGGSGGSRRTSKEHTDARLSLKGDPNSSVTTRFPDGSLDKTRFYDSKGRAYMDRHYTPHGNEGKHQIVPHDHYWDWSDPGDPFLGK